MKFMRWEKDGGAESTVTGLYLVEIKSLFSIVLLRFSNGSREAYHSHAFNCISWLLSGSLTEYHYNGRANRLPEHRRRWLPFVTRRSTFHKVKSTGTSWVLSLRGPWLDNWREFLENEQRVRNLTHGRIEI